MTWHQGISIGDLHYIRSKFAESLGLEGIHLPLFNKATEYFYNNGFFAVAGDKFMTWAWLSDKGERQYLENDFDWLDNPCHKHLWIVEANINAIHARALRKHAGNAKVIKFRRNGKVVNLTITKSAS